MIVGMIAKVRPAFLCASVLALLLPVVVPAQEDAFAPAGEHWFPWVQNNYYARAMAQSCGASKPVYDELTRAVQRLATAWAATPGATGADLYGRMQWNPQGCKSGVLDGDLIYWPWPSGYFRMEPAPGKPGQTRPHFTNETVPLTMGINKPQGITFVGQMNAEGHDEVGYIKATRRISGLPVYDFDHVLVAAVPGRELFKPVTLDEALHRWLQYAYPNEWARERHQALLARLTTAELQQPAYYYRDENNREQIVTAPGTRIFPIVRYNPDYFDKSKPRSAVQLITVDVHFLDFSRDVNDPRVGTQRFARHMLEATDWSQLAALLR